MFQSRLRRCVIALVLVAPGAFAQTCPWLETSVIDAAFPEHAPWEVMAGGQGRCKFSSDPSRYHNNISLTQMLKADAGEAESYVKTVAGGMAKSYLVKPLPAIGKEGAAVRPDESPEQSMLTLIGHKSNVVVMTQMTFNAGVTPEQRATAERLTVDTFDRDTGGGLQLPKR